MGVSAAPRAPLCWLGVKAVLPSVPRAGGSGRVCGCGEGAECHTQECESLGEMLQATSSIALEPEGGSRGGGRRPAAPRACFPGREARGCSRLPFPSDLAGRRLGAQLTVTGKALAKQRGVSSPYCKRRQGAFPWSSPPATLPHVPTSPMGEAGTAWGSPTIHKRSGEKNQPSAERSPISLCH